MSTTNSSSITLAANETVIKDWTYATTSGSVTSSHHLLVTDKRIISTSNSSYKNGQSSARQEMKRSDVASVVCSCGNQNFKLAAIILFVLAAVFAIIALAAPAAFLFIFTAVFAIIGLILFLKKKSYMTLVISSQARNNTVFGIYANAGVVLKSKNAKLKVKVNGSVANEIVSLIGSLVLAQ